MSDWIKDKLEQIDEKIDKTSEKITSLEVNYIGMSKDLNYHIKRTDILENELKPIKKRYDTVVDIGKFIGAVAAFTGCVEGIVHFILKL